jgi:hypothetical protein
VKLSQEKQFELYEIIHKEMTQIRIVLALPGKDDLELARVEHVIWRKLKEALNCQKKMAN